MNKQELASKIWALANNLRGKVSAATYKDYMLGFLFYKYLSDKEEYYLKNNLGYSEEELEEINENDNQPKTNCMNNLGYFISYKNLFSTWIKLDVDFTIENVTVALSAFERYIGTGYKKVFNNIFSTLSTRLTDLGTTDPDRTKNSKEIIKLVKSIPTNNKEDYDVLGFIYEYLLKNFAANAGKAGEFYTPHEASIIMAEIIAYYLRDKEQISIYDPTSGSGSLLINIGQAVSKYLGNKNKVKYYAQELIPETYNLTRMNLVMRDILPGNIMARQGDTLAKDWPYFEDGDPDSTYDYLSVDACCSNPPYSQAWDPRNDPRFDDYGLAPKSKADYAFLLHNLYHLNKDGIMTIVLPHGVLFRGGEEGVIRENLIKKHNIETIIGLPANLFYGTGIPTIIMVLRKHRIADDILFIDASKGFIKDGNKNKLRQRDIRKIVDTVIARKEYIPHYSRLVKYSEIEANDFNLNIPRYVNSNINEVPHDIYSLMYGGIPNEEIDGEKFAKFWEKFPSLKDELFVKKDIPFSDLKNDDIMSIIENNLEVKEFINDHKNKYSYLRKYLEKELLDDPKNIHLSSEENKIAQTLRDKLSGEDLIDYYDCFEALDNQWQNISLDLELVKENGLEIAKEIDEIKVLKKDSKTKKLEEKPVGFDGKLIPYSLIQSVYYFNEANEVEDIENELANCTSQKDELFESIDPDDKNELLKNDESGEIDSKKLKAKISDIKKQIKKGAEYEEDSYEQIVLEIDKLSTDISKLKSTLKVCKGKLNELNENKIKNLTDEEIHSLLIMKWINPICCEIENLGINLIKKFEKDIKKLAQKYEITFVDLESQIIETESSLSLMIKELDAAEFDKKGLLEFEKILCEEKRIENSIGKLDKKKYNTEELLEDLFDAMRGE